MIPIGKEEGVVGKMNFSPWKGGEMGKTQWSKFYGKINYPHSLPHPHHFFSPHEDGEVGQWGNVNEFSTLSPSSHYQVFPIMPPLHPHGGEISMRVGTWKKLIEGGRKWKKLNGISPFPPVLHTLEVGGNGENSFSA